MAVTPDGSTLVGIGSTIRRWSLPPEPRTDPDEPRIPADELCRGDLAAISPDGTLLAATSADLAHGSRQYHLRYWRLPSGEPAGAVRMRGHAPTSLAFTPDGTGLLSLGTGPAQFWRLPRPDQPKSVPRRLHRAERMFARDAKVVFSPDGKLVVAGRRKTVRLRRWPDGSTVAYVPTEVVKTVDDLQISPTGDTLIVGGSAPGNSRRVLVALPTGLATAALPWPNPFSPPLFTPDGKYLVLVEPAGPALWRLPGCLPVNAFDRQRSTEPDRVHAAVTADSRLLVTSDSGRAEVFEIPSGRRLGTIELAGAKVLPTADGTLLVGYDREQKLEVRRYRPSRLSQLAERPIGQLTPAESECFHGRYDNPADAALAELGAALLTHARRDRPRDV